VVNSRSAQRLSQLALCEGKQHAFMLRLFRAFFTEGKHIAKHDVLADLAADVGLERAPALEALATGAFEAEVAADQKLGRDLCIRGVPFFVLDGKYAVSGAQPVGAFLKALDTAWKAKAV
jgi:predicted DsbA family dithiol-disulfide isomerase